MNEFWMILLIVVFGVLSLEMGFSTAILEIVAGVIGETSSEKYLHHG